MTDEIKNMINDWSKRTGINIIDIQDKKICLSKTITDKEILHIDVTSYYPSLMIQHGLFTRNSKTPEKYRQIYDTRVALKKAGKKKEQFPFKIILNSTYGIHNSNTSSAYDPLYAHMICMTGQLGLLDLHDKLNKALGDDYEIIQSNTDGIVCRISKKNHSLLLDICKEWEQRLHLGLDKDGITKIIQKDVNNYWFKFDNGKTEVKGAMLKEKSELDNDLPITNECMLAYFESNQTLNVSEYVKNCNDLIKFQKVVRLQGAYKYTHHNNKKMSDKTYRIFASKDIKDTSLCKSKLKDDGTWSMEKFANSSEHVKIINENIQGKSCPDWLDKQWYINLIYDRLEDFGFDARPSIFDMF